MTALLVFCAATLACAAAPGIEALTAARTLQGFGASGAIVLARAIIRDLYEGARAGRELSIMAMIMGLAPIIGPMIGGAVQTVFGWRADFVLIFAAGAVAATLSWRLLPETRRAATAPLSFGNVLRSYRLLLGHRGYLANIALVAISFCGLFAWISASPFVLQDLYGLSAFSYGLAFGLAAVGFMLGTSLAATIVVRLGLDRTIGLGAAVLAAGGLALLAAVGFLPRSGAQSRLAGRRLSRRHGPDHAAGFCVGVAAVSPSCRCGLRAGRRHPAIGGCHRRCRGGARAGVICMAAGDRGRIRRVSRTGGVVLHRRGAQGLIVQRPGTASNWPRRTFSCRPCSRSLGQ
jgi:MFS family permease